MIEYGKYLTHGVGNHHHLQQLQLTVTPGSSALSFVYGFNVVDSAKVEGVLKDLLEKIKLLDGTGVEIQLTPNTQPNNLAEMLLQHGFKLQDEAELLVYELQDNSGNSRIPEVRTANNILAKEISSERDCKNYLKLTSVIFGEPEPTDETLKSFISDFHKGIQKYGHSDQFLAFDKIKPIGLAGLDITGQVAWLYGAGVLEQYRKKGVYGLLLRMRCEEAIKRGTEIALVTARTGTSGPILKQHGFRKVGPVHTYEISW